MEAQPTAEIVPSLIPSAFASRVLKLRKPTSILTYAQAAARMGAAHAWGQSRLVAGSRLASAPT